MPDLINPDFTDGKTQHIVWKDELCASCLNVGSCPLLQCLHENVILSHSGIHVARCGVYSPDVESAYYISPDADMQVIAMVNAEALQQEVDQLNDMLKKVVADVLVC